MDQLPKTELQQILIVAKNYNHRNQNSKPNTMLRTTLLAALAFTGAQAVDISAAAQIEMGSNAIEDLSGIEGMLA